MGPRDLFTSEMDGCAQYSIRLRVLERESVTSIMQILASFDNHSDSIEAVGFCKTYVRAFYQDVHNLTETGIQHAVGRNRIGRRHNQHLGYNGIEATADSTSRGMIHPFNYKLIRPLIQSSTRQDAVTQLRWHATEPFFTSVSADRTVRVWDARTGECLKVFRGHHETILDFAISTDGRTIVTGSDDGSALVFTL